MVGDYFKSDTTALRYTDKATGLIKWLRSKSLLLAMIRKVRIDASLSPLSVIRAVLTRWTAHYMAYKRLCDLRQTLLIVISNDDMQALDINNTVITGDAKAKSQARKYVCIIKDEDFWCALLR